MSKKPKVTKSNIVNFPESRVFRQPEDRVPPTKKKPGPKPQPIKRFLERLYNDKRFVSRKGAEYTKAAIVAWDDVGKGYIMLATDDCPRTDLVFLLESIKQSQVEYVRVDHDLEGYDEV